VAYDIEIERLVVDYIEAPGRLPRPAQVLVFRAIYRDLGGHGDFYRGRSECRLPKAPDCFWHDLLFDYLGRRHHLWFIVNDSMAPYGVLRVEYVDSEAPRQ
jgi:hypothetical protein